MLIQLILSHRWSVATGERLFEIEGLRKVKNKLREGAADDAKPRAPSQAHTGDVLSLALSTDDKFLASGGADKQVIIWDAAQGGWLKTFPGHRAMVTALSFRRQSHQLFSGSGVSPFHPHLFLRTILCNN